MTCEISYAIDGNDDITTVGGAWSSFARENGGRGLDPSCVVGRSIWEFIDGDPVRGLYGRLFRGLRERPQEAMIPFRCDAPDVVRECVLTLRSLPAIRGVELVSRILSERNREPVLLPSRDGSGPEVSVRSCSVCRRVSAGDTWTDAEAAIRRRRLFNRSEQLVLREEVCPSCSEFFERP